MTATAGNRITDFWSDPARLGTPVAVSAWLSGSCSDQQPLFLFHQQETRKKLSIMRHFRIRSFKFQSVLQCGVCFFLTEYFPYIQCPNVRAMLSIRCAGFTNGYSNIIYRAGKADGSGTRYREERPARNLWDLGILTPSLLEVTQLFPV